MRNNYLMMICISLLVTGIFSCRKDDVKPKEEVPVPPQESKTVEGFYLLNEGMMGANMASLDYYDYATGKYSKDIYAAANPDAVKELGDVGNDLAVYGGKLYAVINVSNKVEVMDVATAKRIKTITINSARYVSFHEGKAYVSSYDGEVWSSVNGTVFEIDTVSLEISRKVEVGRQPEQIAIVGGKLYVANSGGYSPPNYERTVSVIDLATFKKVKDIEVDVNLHLLNVDAEGDLYVSSRGDYYDIPANYYVIDTKTDAVKKKFDIAVSGCAIAGDTAYVYATDWSYVTGGWEVTYNMIDTKTETVLNKSFITDGTDSEIETPYGIAIDPVSRNIYITDAKDYASSGTLYGYNKEGKREFSVTAGNIPGRIAFKYKK